MISIRSITYSLSHEITDDELSLVNKIAIQWEKKSSLIHTQRICTYPLTEPLSNDIIDKLSFLCDSSSIRWFNIAIDPWKSNKVDELFDFSQSVLREYNRSFINVLTVRDGCLDFDYIRKSIELVKSNSCLSSNGRDNFRLGCSFNVSENGAFFPFTFSGGSIGFSIALEMTKEINKICDENYDLSLTELQQKIISELSLQIRDIHKLAEEIAIQFGVAFHGFDFSLAPEIDKSGSVIHLLNRIGVFNYGKTGTFFATAYYTNILKALGKSFPNCGFSGIMYSLLEDLELCMINNEKGVTLEEIISLSTMCGCGVDMVPVPRDISCDEMISIFLDVYAISTRLQKPLGIRILPIPYARKNIIKYTNFSEDADFIVNTRVVQTDGNVLDECGIFKFISLK